MTRCVVLRGPRASVAGSELGAGGSALVERLSRPRRASRPLPRLEIAHLVNQRVSPERMPGTLLRYTLAPAWTRIPYCGWFPGLFCLPLPGFIFDYICKMREFTRCKVIDIPARWGLRRPITLLDRLELPAIHSRRLEIYQQSTVFLDYLRIQILLDFLLRKLGDDVNIGPIDLTLARKESHVVRCKLDISAG